MKISKYPLISKEELQKEGQIYLIIEVIELGISENGDNIGFDARIGQKYTDTNTEPKATPELWTDIDVEEREGKDVWSIEFMYIPMDSYETAERILESAEGIFGRKFTKYNNIEGWY